ncbi:MAG: hypothetical protein HY652_14425 [Acidobacteria bacterium]|nr:hypothetical protein [Acidobacteriota bacterium]
MAKKTPAMARAPIPFDIRFRGSVTTQRLEPPAGDAVTSGEALMVLLKSAHVGEPHESRLRGKAEVLVNFGFVTYKKPNELHEVSRSTGILRGVRKDQWLALESNSVLLGPTTVQGFLQMSLQAVEVDDGSAFARRFGKWKSLLAQWSPVSLTSPLSWAGSLLELFAQLSKNDTLVAEARTFFTQPATGDRADRLLRLGDYVWESTGPTDADRTRIVTEVVKF